MKTINEQIYDALEETMHPASIPHVDYDGCDLRLDGEFSVSDLEKIIQVINGDYEPKIETVSLDWLAGSGIDCDFCDDGESWIIDRLDGIFNQNIEYKYVNTYSNCKYCRPRQNQPMVLTDGQVKLIPEGFDYDSWCYSKRDCHGIFYIVTFKGLKDGYKYEWEE